MSDVEEVSAGGGVSRLDREAAAEGVSGAGEGVSGAGEGVSRAGEGMSGVEETSVGVRLSVAEEVSDANGVSGEWRTQECLRVGRRGTVAATSAGSPVYTPTIPARRERYLRPVSGSSLVYCGGRRALSVRPALAWQTHGETSDLQGSKSCGDSGLYTSALVGDDDVRPMH